MVRAYHAIFSTYGFWLPNDPRGSWTDFAASWEIYKYGVPVPANTRISVAHRAHDHQRRLAAKKALQHDPVIFTGIQARAVARGFALATNRSKYRILACAIMPDHVHLVVHRHERTIERIVGHLKGRASTALLKEDLHPFQELRLRDGTIPSPWAEKCWKVLLDTDTDITRAIRYVDNNPLREGYRPQRWSFLTAVETAG